MSQTTEQRVAAARARMAELTVKFIERTRAELDIMRARLAALDAEGGSALAEIRNLAHRICGTGATLGFEALAEQAHKIEKLAAALSSAVPPDAAMLRHLAGEIDALVGEVGRLESRHAAPL